MADWHHAPVHRLSEAGAYMVTAGTLHKAPFFNTPERLSLMQDLLFQVAEEYQWQLQAWAIMNNHYHFVALATGPSGNLRSLVTKLHAVSANALNKLDDATGRKVWFQYWDTHITFEKSYFPRLRYVHENPVHHKLALVADQYQWCSARWFKREAGLQLIKKVQSFGIDRLKVVDDF